MEIRTCNAADEYQLLICLTYGVWGFKKTNLCSDWQIGDKLIMLLKDEIYDGWNGAAVVEIISEPFCDNLTQIWDDHLYPYRVKIKPILYLERFDRPNLTIELKVSAKLLGENINHGLVISQQKNLRKPVAEKMLSEMNSHENALDLFFKNPNLLLKSAWDIKNRDNALDIENSHKEVKVLR